MKYLVEDNKIIIFSKNEFNPQHILECGQIFSYKKINDKYVVYSVDKKATINVFEDRIEIETNNIAYFTNFFDLNTDYSKLKCEIIQNYPFLKNAICFGYGIRILKQNPLETIISFIISSNNNIKRIQKILFALRENYGTNMGDYYAFPTLDQLENIKEDDYKKLGAGYRAKYLYNTVQQLKNIDLNNWCNFSTNELNNHLLELMGVGQKVADCIMLFAFSKMDVFPVDTWIEKVFCTYFHEEHNRKIIRKNLLNEFGVYSGYVQQYLFYSQREN